MGKFWRTLLNLPEKSAQEDAGRTKAAPSADPWNVAGQAAAERAAQTRHSGSGWTPVEPVRSARVWQRVLRGLVVAVLLFFLLAGVRTVFFSGDGADQGQAIPEAEFFPETAAAGVAERYVKSYYTWDAATPDARASALSLDLAGGSVESGSFGWDETGKQTVQTATVANVEAQSRTQAIVTVRYDVTPYTMEGEDWVPGTRRTSAADVTVQVLDGRVSVVGPPALVAIPEAPSAPGTDSGTVVDPSIADETREYATTFFRAYGQNADVAALTVPGARITGIGGIELDRVTEWTVETGTGDERQAAATVTWLLPEGTTLDQSYDVTLQQVTSGNTERWQVAAIQGK